MLNRVAQVVMIFSLTAAYMPVGVQAAMPGTCPMSGSQSSVEIGVATCKHCPLPASDSHEQPSSGSDGCPGLMTCCCAITAFVDTGTVSTLVETPALESVREYDRTAIDFKSEPPSPPPRPVS